MIMLYHGSYMPIITPFAKAGRKNLDFGQGFYATKIKEQAQAWAQIIASRKGRGVSSVVSIYSFDDKKAVEKGVRIKHFESYDLEWLDYVIACRKGKDISDEFDIVEGGVANDNVIDTVEDYEKGIITAEQALGQLRYKKINYQICFLNQSVIDDCLTFVDSINLKMVEELI